MNVQYSLDDDAEKIRLKAAWINSLERLGAEVSPNALERFLRPLEPLGIRDGIARFETPGAFVMEWVEKQHLASIERVLSDELGEPIRVDLKAVSRLKSQAELPLTATISAPVTPTAPSFSTPFQPIPKFTFENFVVGQSNRLCYAGARAVAEDPGAKFNPLFIYGSSGLGKTHLLHAIANQVLEKTPDFPVYYVTAQRFAEEFVSSLQNGRTEQFRKYIRSACIWLVDDIQFILGRDKTCEEVFHTFNNLHTSGKQIVLCSDRPPRDLFLMDERLRSRFEAGLVADVQMPDTETRCAILLSKASHESIQLDHDVAMLLAENVPGNIRVLEGALTRLAVQASIFGQSPSLELAQEMLENYYRKGSLAKPSVRQIVEAVSNHFKIDPVEIQGSSRKAPIVHARHIAVYITREITHDSWKHIGSQFGDRDHTSMMHGYQKVSQLIHDDRETSSTVKMLIRNLYPDA